MKTGKGHSSGTSDTKASHWLRFDTLWPLLLVALGVGLVLKSRRPASA